MFTEMQPYGNVFYVILYSEAHSSESTADVKLLEAPLLPPCGQNVHDKVVLLLLSFCFIHHSTLNVLMLYLV